METCNRCGRQSREFIVRLIAHGNPPLIENVCLECAMKIGLFKRETK